jgi:CBS domain-containing protein
VPHMAHDRPECFVGIRSCDQRARDLATSRMSVSNWSAENGLPRNAMSEKRTLSRGAEESSMRIEEVMTRDVVTVRPETSVQAAAKLMLDHRISGLPVIDEHRSLLGIISEGDLILRQRSWRSRSNRPWWRRFFDDPEALVAEYRKVAGTTVGEVMTRRVVSISPVYGIETAASILHARGFRRLPVVYEGKLVGIITRGDLVRVLARPAPHGHDPL